MDVNKTVERIKEICPNLANKGENRMVFTIDENKAVDEIYELMIDLFVAHKKKPFTEEELQLINPLYNGWYGFNIETDVEEEIQAEKGK